MSKIFTSKQKIRKIFKGATEERIDDFYSTFKEFAKRFSITTEVHENYFLAQIVAETGYKLKGKRENLNYSCKSLKKIFKRYKNNPKWARRDGRCDGHKANQMNIGNIAYAGRIGNGKILSGDGYRFRGGGFFQLTGRSNYRRMSKVIQQTIGDAIGSAGLAYSITETRMSTLSALAFWLDNECYECGHIHCVTKKINRYTDSYKKRKKLYQWIATIPNKVSQFN